MDRSSGVLLHISSLPSDHGIGTFGDEARKFVDFLKESDQTYWQILPLSQTGYGDSPYQSFSVYAGNPYFIDLDYLCNDGLLERSDYENIDWNSTADSINYETMYQKRYPVLKKAVQNLFNSNNLDEYYRFIDENKWVEDYALFMAIKNTFNDNGFELWPKEYRLKDQETIEIFIEYHKDLINFYKAVQYLFSKQWFSLKEYANEKGIKIIGDCPIYISRDSCDLWMRPDLFQVDEDLKLVKVAGCPPDAFSERGQLWGNPLYDWDRHKEDGYSWWVDRVKYLTKLYDVVRIDHFRGLSAYYSIDADAIDAIYGKWIKGPGKDLIEAINRNLDASIIAEDLGFQDQDVKDLLEYSKYPGMSVLQFGFDSRDANNNDNILHNFRKNSVVYTGTHDNETMIGWLESVDKKEVEFAKDYVHMCDDETFNWACIRSLLASVADVAIIPAQDLLGLDNSSRMNTPSTMGENWKWRLDKNAFDETISKRLKHYTNLYGRY